MTLRGYSVVALHQPKTAENIGGVLRAAACYGVAQVNLACPRARRGVRHATNTSRAERHLPVYEVDDVLAMVPIDAAVVAVDLIEGSTELPRFVHPERAVYVFGPEDGTLGPGILERADHVVHVPMRLCMNLASCVQVVLYDRLLKQKPLRRVA